MEKISYKISIKNSKGTRYDTIVFAPNGVEALKQIITALERIEQINQK